MKCFMAIDLGASSGRAILGRLDGGRIELEELHRFENGGIEIGGNLHWNLIGLFKEIKTGLRKAAEQGVELSGIAIDTWGVDFALIDRHGTFLGFPYHYRDSRTSNVFDYAFKSVPREDFYEETGIQFMSINTIFQLIAMKHNDDPVLGIADRFLMMPNALTYMLCGDISTEYTIATTSQAYNPATGDWAWGLIEALGLPKDIFPEIRQPGSVVGILHKSLADELGCGEVPVILVGSHDTASAVAAVPATGDKKWAFLSSGTWSLFGRELEKPLIDDAAMAANFTNEGGVGGRIRFLTNIMGLWLVQESRAEWARGGRKYSFAELEKMAREAEPFRSVINPNDESFVAPGDMPGRIQQFCKRTGQPVPETPGQVVRCAVESLALKYRQSVEELETVTAEPVEVLHLVGGGTQDKMLNQFTANAINRIVVAGPVEATATGNLLVQAMAAGEIGSLEELRRVVRNSFDTETYTPQDVDTWNEQYRRFQSLCRG
jgi:rhamnulokinase